MKNISVASLVAVVLALCACATQPTPQPTAAKAPPPPPPVAAPATATSPTAAAASTDPQKIEIANYARATGYKPVTRNGKQVWCKNEAPLGSNLAKTTCVPDDVILEQKRLAAQGQQDLLQKRNCGGPTCNGS